MAPAPEPLPAAPPELAGRVEPVASLDDPRLAPYANLKDSELRARQGLFLVEGRWNVERLITASRHPTHSVFVTEAGLRGIAPALARLDPATPIYRAEPSLMREVTGIGFHRGCLAAGERGGEARPAEVLRLAADRPRRVLVLEDVGNADNVGGVFRNALAFGVDAVLLTPRSVDPLYRKSIRVSMGASLCVPFARAASTREALSALAEAGFQSVALHTAREARPLASWRDVPGRVALWLGSEGEGLAPETLAALPERVTIPMTAGSDSLNLATAAGIALHHLADATPRG